MYGSILKHHQIRRQTTLASLERKHGNLDTPGTTLGIRCIGWGGLWGERWVSNWLSPCSVKIQKVKRFLQYVHYTHKQNETLMQHCDVVTKKDAVFFSNIFPFKLILKFLGVNRTRWNPTSEDFKFCLKLFGDVAMGGEEFCPQQKPLKIDAWTMTFPFSHGLFSGVLLVSGRVHWYTENWESCLPSGIVGPPCVPRWNEGSANAHPSSDVAGKRRFNG